MVSDAMDSFFEGLVHDMQNPKIQAELLLVVKNMPKEYRNKVENQELGLDGIRKTKEGYIQNGRPAPQDSIDAALRRVDMRMLRESPVLIEKKLKFVGGELIPDKMAYRRDLDQSKRIGKVMR